MKALRIALPMAFILGLITYMLFLPLTQRTSYAVTPGESQANRQQLASLSKNDTLSPLFVQVAKAVKPAVVEVRVTKKVTLEQSPDLNEFFRHFFGDETTPGTPQNPRRPNRQQPREFVQRGLGSGVIVDAKNGYVLTNYHVVGGADETQIVLSDGRRLKAEWARTDPMSDLAVVKVEAKDLVDAPLGDSEAVQVGEWVMAVGSPEALSQTVTAGIISAKGRVTDHTNTYQSFLQTDAAINRGNSGGPLVNMRGEIIGINSAILSESGGNEGIGFAIPSNMVKSVMTQLIEKGKVTRGYLGVTIQAVDEKLAKSFKLPSSNGALVTSATPDAPAAKAGLKSGDFIVAIAGKAMEGPNDLRNLVASLEPGKSVPVEYYRDGKKATTNVTIEAQPANLFAAGPKTTQPREAAPNKLGLEVANVTRELAQQYGYKAVPTGVIITNVASGSPADLEGLKEGMVITQIGDKNVTTADEFNQAVAAKEAAEGVRLRITDPTGGASFIFLTPSK